MWLAVIACVVFVIYHTHTKDITEKRVCLQKMTTQNRDGDIIRYNAIFQNEKGAIFEDHDIDVAAYFRYEVGASYWFTDQEFYWK